MSLQRAPDPDPYKNFITSNDQTVIAWTNGGGEPCRAIADSRCLSRELEQARISRRPAKYKHRRNYEGYYWCAGSGESVWYESMTEYSALMNMDHTCDVRKVAAQPMCILFGDGSRHYPDYFAVHASGSQVLYDVKPVNRIDEEVLRQFSRTAEVARQIGWSYEVLHGVTGVERHNLEWLAAYRHPYIAPSDAIKSQILGATERPLPLRELATALDPRLPARFLPAIYHMMWKRILIHNRSVPLGWHTRIGLRSHG
jgi:hypothetical protein